MGRAKGIFTRRIGQSISTLLVLVLSAYGCGAKLVRERPISPKSPPMMTRLSESSISSLDSFGAHLMGKTEQEVLVLLGPPAKRYKGVEKGNEEWYYAQPRKAKLYFQNGKVDWWNLTEASQGERDSATQKSEKKRKGKNTKHQRVTPNESSY